jgi:methylase of polypeptide subunit release factors
MQREKNLQRHIQQIIAEKDNYEIAQSRFQLEIKDKLGLKFQIFPKVFPPFYFDASIEMAKILNEVHSGNPISNQKILSVGIGSGIDFVHLVNEGIRKTIILPKLFATDINPCAIANTQSNFDFLDKCDQPILYNTPNIEKLDERFDVICWNCPFFGKTYIPSKEINLQIPKHFFGSRFDENYQSLNSILRQARSRLKSDGNFVLMYSEFGSEQIQNAITYNGYSCVQKTLLEIKQCIRQNLPKNLKFQVHIDVLKQV